MSYPIKLSLKSEIMPILLVIASVVLSFYFYTHFPDRVITHWDFKGQPNGYSGRFSGAFAIPILLAAIYLLFLALPALDPRSQRYHDFAGAYHFIKAAIITVLFATFVAAGFYNLGYHIDIGVVIPVVIGLLMIVIGNYMGKIKRNWFMGIKTPWTLSSENVWNKTHRLGGYLFTAFGIVLIISPFLPWALSTALFLFGVVVLVFGTMGYSYLEYRKEQKQNSSGQEV